ncbi:MAG: hypothetical protein QW741_01635 [Sulfolobales archaeon]
MTVLPDFIIVAFLSFLAVASVVWYFRMRKKTLVLTKRVTEELEKAFKPVDKTYVLLGYLVGYRAKYELESGDRVYILFTTAPRHSILYYPIARALKRTDRLEIAIENFRRHVVRDLHAVDLSENRLRAVLLRDLGAKTEVISKRVIETSRGNYVVYYEDSGDVELVKRLLESAELKIYKLSAFTKNNLVELVAEIREDSVPSLVKALREFNRYVTRGSS